MTSKLATLDELGIYLKKLSEVTEMLPSTPNDIETKEYKDKTKQIIQELLAKLTQYHENVNEMQQLLHKLECEHERYQKLNDKTLKLLEETQDVVELQPNSTYTYTCSLL